MIALLVIAILVFLIVVHELGHFIAAKIFGVKVTEFGVGYPPRAFLFGKIGDTEYSLNWIPFGGFVRLFGDDGDKQHGVGSFVDSPRWKQAVILVAGVTMNALAAWLLFSSAYAVGILHPVDSPSPTSRLIVSDLVVGSPADVAGIQVGDDIVALTDDKGASPAPLTPETVLDFVSARAGAALSITYKHLDATTTAIVHPAHAVVASEAGRPAIGVGLVLVTTESLPWKQAFIEGYYQSLGTLEVSIAGLWNIIKTAAHGAPDLQHVTGPVGLVSYVAEASRSGLGYVLSLAGFISINLAVINLIPIPALDGGRLLIVGIEALMRRNAPRLALQLLNTLGVALIIMLMVTVTYHDIIRLVT
ncbi:MAG: site-2 protease family protein [Candidatus Kaiserbacteria bacterium]|nr:site-2 protease family protein [Candidatus Kaiserbacteria bacterium]